ncbi:MAG: CDP-diacylglycerol--glycerol-3-phosphate 3-phosphatidyltransferase [Holosporales bacterium]|jgi:cardiolipin synthase|nr:CDP-diacylglycerol--glycerol-3-phosphate 3-phosphatidyltransferase [Holosporales bacterium]
MKIIKLFKDRLRTCKCKTALETLGNVICTVPNLLTVSRVLLLPVFAVGFFMESRCGAFVSLLTFICCCITDYLDGYYARAYKQTTKLGKILDPLADKILVSIAVLFIIGFNMVSKYAMIPSAIILCREIMISGLRDSEEYSGGDFQTSVLSKWKTATQMFSISIILFSAILKSDCILKIGEATLWFSSVIAVLSGFLYCRRYMV